MLRIVEARKAAVPVATDQAVVLEFLDADLKAQVGPQGAYQPRTGVLKASGTGVISNITKMICRRKDSPDQLPVLVFKLTNGLTLAEFNAMLAHDTVGLDLPKYPVLGGYEIVLTLDLGTAVSDVSLVTKGENSHSVSIIGTPLGTPASGGPPGFDAAGNPDTGVAGFPQRRFQVASQNIGGQIQGVHDLRTAGGAIQGQGMS